MDNAIKLQPDSYYKVMRNLIDEMGATQPLYVVSNCVVAVRKASLTNMLGVLMTLINIVKWFRECLQLNPLMVLRLRSILWSLLILLNL